MKINLTRRQWFLGTASSLAASHLQALRPDANGTELAAGFQHPPAEARPWVFWFWINGNISKEGITADLEGLERAGVGGVLWMEVSGPWWAPDGGVEALSPQWYEAFQWAVRECRRLGIQFDVSIDFGYGGSGGPQITPELSMQELVWSETEIEGGGRVTAQLDQPKVTRKIPAWLRPGAQLSAKVLEQLKRSDSYRDVAVVAVPLPARPEARAYRISQLEAKSGLGWKSLQVEKTAPPPEAVVPPERVIDLTARMDPGGGLQWDAPAGKWLVIRYGHASNNRLTRPSPAGAVGLQCDLLSRAGIEAQFEGFVKKLAEGAGDSAGRTLSFVHVDSWEAGAQNWTASFPAEFLRGRGYDLRPWLPVMSGHVVGSLEVSERFLWDIRMTASEMIRDNYAVRLKELARPYGIKFSTEAYGRLNIDNLAYAGVSDMPVSEFWAGGKSQFPTPLYGEATSKAMASAAHTMGRTVTGAEAFTSDRGWRDHPFLLKGMGDRIFCRGVNRFIFHLSAHQPRNDMVPGLTHRRWGEQFQRHNTWWSYSSAWIGYLTRSQYMLQQGLPVADVCYWFGEGAPLSVDDMQLDIPAGYDFDFCSSESVLRMKVDQGSVVLPSGTRYRYLLLPDSDLMTLPLATKVEKLVEAGARVIAQKKPRATPDLTDYVRADREVARIGSALWDGRRIIAGIALDEVFRGDGLAPDFEGEGLSYIHRRAGDAEIYFVSHQENRPLDRICTFRVAGKQPELWNPETGAIRDLPDFTMRNGRTSVPLHFEPMGSWFVVFRRAAQAAGAGGRKNFTAPRTLRGVAGEWRVTFDPRWGGPARAAAFEDLSDWSRHPDPHIHYYSGTAVYRRTLKLSEAEVAGKEGPLLLDLGAVEVMARVKLNGKECGIAWKPPYQVDLTGAARAGANELEIDVVNLWINRMIGDEQLPEDSVWKDFETLTEWPEWFRERRPRPSGRFTFTTCKHYTKDSPLAPSGLLGPVALKAG